MITRRLPVEKRPVVRLERVPDHEGHWSARCEVPGCTFVVLDRPTAVLADLVAVHRQAHRRGAALAQPQPVVPVEPVASSRGWASWA